MPLNFSSDFCSLSTHICVPRNITIRYKCSMYVHHFQYRHIGIAMLLIYLSWRSRYRFNALNSNDSHCHYVVTSFFFHELMCACVCHEPVSLRVQQAINLSYTYTHFTFRRNTNFSWLKQITAACKYMFNLNYYVFLSMMMSLFGIDIFSHSWLLFMQWFQFFLPLSIHFLMKYENARSEK